ncbi:MAG: GntR family transcriptional regulator [Chloroflexi bacterium]|nr:GntR family transcriptional regulator [Chloroflexota bacterium]
MSKNFTPIQVSLGQQVVEYLRERIYKVEIPPGSQLNAVDIARQLGISRSPVRDALLILAAEGLVEQASNSGYKVIEFNQSLVKDVFAVRIALEPIALREGMIRFGSSFLDDQRELWSNFDAKTLSDQDWREIYVVADNKLHETIMNASENRLLREVLDKIIKIVMAIRHWQFLHGTPREEIVSTQEEHLRIFASVASGDVNKALETLITHIENSRLRALSRFEDRYPKD